MSSRCKFPLLCSSDCQLLYLNGFLPPLSLFFNFLAPNLPNLCQLPSSFSQEHFKMERTQFLLGTTEIISMNF